MPAKRSRRQRNAKDHAADERADAGLPSEVAHAGDTTSNNAVTQARRGWRGGVLLPALASALALWAAFAPLHWSALAWLAPIGWLVVIDRKQAVGAGGYFSLWLSGCLFWLLILHGIRLAFWALVFGWLAMSLYLAIYTPLFVATARLLRHRWQMPLVIAAPIAWIGMETIRGYLLTGYPGNSLAHTQVATPLLIQSADQFGVAGIALVMVAVSVGVLRLVQAARGAERAATLPAIFTASALFASLLTYGYWKLAEAEQLRSQQQPVLRAMLVQENTPTIFEYNPERSEQAWTRYLDLTRTGAREHGPLDLVVWPESTFTANAPLYAAQLTKGIPAELKEYGYDVERTQALVERFQQDFDFRVAQLLKAATGRGPFDPPQTDTPLPHLLVGCDYQLITSERLSRYNSALFIDPQGKVVDIYNKMHLVMFGEYIPLGGLLKWLGDAFGLGGAEPGQEAKSLNLDGVRLAPNICFESMIPRLIAWQVGKLSAEGQAPDVLVNLTNDSWFRGSSVLDHHLASTILVAVENRRPMLVAANTGLSAHIEGSGRVVQVTQRMQPATLLAEVTLDGRGGLVQWLGYPLSWLAATLSILAWLVPQRWIRAS